MREHQEIGICMSLCCGARSCMPPTDCLAVCVGVRVSVPILLSNFMGARLAAQVKSSGKSSYAYTASKRLHSLR
jgi:hypothetical protein